MRSNSSRRPKCRQRSLLRVGGDSLMSRPYRWPSALPEKDSCSIDPLIPAALSFAATLRASNEACARSRRRKRAPPENQPGGETIRRRWPAEIMDNCRRSSSFQPPGQGTHSGKGRVGLCRGAGGTKKGWSGLRRCGESSFARLELTGVGILLLAGNRGKRCPMSSQPNSPRKSSALMFDAIRSHPINWRR